MNLYFHLSFRRFRGLDICEPVVLRGHQLYVAYEYGRLSRLHLWGGRDRCGSWEYEWRLVDQGGGGGGG